VVLDPNVNAEGVVFPVGILCTHGVPPSRRRHNGWHPMQRPAHMALPSLQVTSASWPSTQWGASLKWELHQHWGYFGHPCAHFGRHLVGKFQIALWAPSWARWAPFGALWALPGTTLLTPLAQLEPDELCTPVRWHCAESLTYAGCCKFSIYTAFAWARAGAATCFSDRTSRSNPRIPLDIVDAVQ
jgi:hypothetical protein